MIKFNPLPRQKPYSTVGDFFIFLKMFFTGSLIDGPCISEFESLLKKEFDCKHALAVGSCRSSFALIIEALNVMPGDEVILPALNLSAFPKILKYMGIKPVFVDIDQYTFNIDTVKLEEAITPKTKAIVAVHLYGNVCDMEKIMSIGSKYKICVIEDCANAFMTKFKEKYVGTYGDVACFSHGHSKDLPTFGGGSIITNKSDLYQKIRELRDKSFDKPSFIKLFKVFVKNLFLKIATLKYVYMVFIYPMIWFGVKGNFDVIAHFIEDKDVMIKRIDKVRFTNFQAYVGIAKLKLKNSKQQKRIELAKQLNQELFNIKDLTFPRNVEGGVNAYFNYPVLCGNRSQLIRNLIKYGIDAKVIQNYDCNSHEIFKEYRKHCPITEKTGNQLIAIPLYSMMNKGDVTSIADILNEIYNE